MRVTPARRPANGQMLPGLDLPQPPVPGGGRGPLHALREGISHLLNEPPPMPGVDERVRLIVSQIDFSGPAVVLWVPGTNEYWTEKRFLEAMRRAVPGQRVVPVPYEATWRFSTSVPDGIAVLRGVLREVERRKRPGQRVLLAGESQGSWIISTVLTDRRYRRLVDRVAVWGHPGVAPGHHHSPNRKVREVNSPADIVTVPLGAARDDVLAGIEQISRRNLIGGVRTLAGFAVQRPDMIVTLLKGQVWRMPLVGKGARDPHNYDDDFARGARFLAAAIDAGAQPRQRARKASRRAGGTAATRAS